MYHGTKAEFMMNKAHESRRAVQESLVENFKAKDAPYQTYKLEREKGTAPFKARLKAIDKQVDKLCQERRDIEGKLYVIAEKAGEKLYKAHKIEGYQDRKNGVYVTTYPAPSDHTFQKFLSNTTSAKALEIAWTAVEEAIYLGGSKNLAAILEGFRTTCNQLTK